MFIQLTSIDLNYDPNEDQIFINILNITSFFRNRKKIGLGVTQFSTDPKNDAIEEPITSLITHSPACRCFVKESPEQIQELIHKELNKVFHTFHAFTSKWYAG